MAFGVRVDAAGVTAGSQRWTGTRGTVPIVSGDVACVCSGATRAAEAVKAAKGSAAHASAAIRVCRNRRSAGREGGGIHEPKNNPNSMPALVSKLAVSILLVSWHRPHACAQAGASLHMPKWTQLSRPFVFRASPSVPGFWYAASTEPFHRPPAPRWSY